MFYSFSKHKYVQQNIDSIICPEKAQRDIPLYIPAIETGISASAEEVIPP
jgi:hypothetical protein